MASTTLPPIRDLLLQRCFIVEDRDLWLKVAGPLPFDPTIDALVYYYPHGHIKHTCNSLGEPLSLSISRDYKVLCKINSVSFLVDNDSEEVLAKLVLQPIQEQEPPVWDEEEAEPQHDSAISYSKDLTKSDLTRLRLSVTTSGTDKVFPEHVGGNSEPLSMNDLFKNTWKFGHRYCMWSNCYHLSGWKDYVSSKGLTEGDTIVFKKNDDGSLSLAFHRKKRYAAPNYANFCVRKNKEFHKDAYFVREALNLVKQNMPFQVTFYPKWSDFLFSPVLRESLRKCTGVRKVPECTGVRKVPVRKCTGVRKVPVKLTNSNGRGRRH